MIRWLAIGTVLGLLLSATAVAAPRPGEPEIRVQFDRDRFIAGQPFEVTVEVTANGRAEPQIRIPRQRGMEVLDESVSRPSSGFSFSFSFGSGGSQRVVTNSGTWVHTLILRAMTPGAYSFGPVSVTLDGQTYAGRTYPVEVLSPAAAQQVDPSATDALARSTSGAKELVLEDVKVDPDYFLHMIPSTRQCTVGELVVLDVYLFTSVRGIRADQFEREPGTEGFWVERFEDADPTTVRNQRVVIGGVLYEQVLLRKLALFPLEAGSLTIAPPVFSFSVGGGGFFGFGMGKAVRRAAQPVTIDVQPLPPDPPAGFDVANVGQYSVFQEVSQNTVKVGEPVTVTLTVKGRGNVRNVVLPQIGEIPGAKVYPPETDGEVIAREEMVSGLRQSRTLLIPEREGKIELPPVTWSWFDVATRKYETRTVAGSVIDVQPGSGPVARQPDGPRAAAPTAPALDRMNSRMRTIESRPDVRMSRLNPMGSFWYMALVVGVPLSWLLFFVVSVVKDRASRHPAKHRSARALAVAERALRNLATAGTNDQFHGQLQRTLIRFVEDRLDEVVTGDTMPQLLRRLEERGVPGDLAREFVAKVEACEFARFARSADAATGREQELQDAISLLRKLAQAALMPPNGGAR